MNNKLSAGINQYYEHLITDFEPDSGVFWCYANPSPRPCFTPELLRDLLGNLHDIKNSNSADIRAGQSPKISYLVLGSYRPGVFSLGGDLDLFVRCIKSGDREKLANYMRLSIEVLYGTHTNMDVPLTTIALIRGNALGAGFEGALSCDYIVAEKHVQLGFPEVLFNMFPGMGAYSFLSRRIRPAEVERMILSGRIYTAEELFDIGVIDHLAESGKGVESTREFIRLHNKNNNTRRSLLKIRNLINPVTLEELLDIGEIWVEAAMRLSSRELKIMERLIRSQDKVAKTLVKTEADNIQIA